MLEEAKLASKNRSINQSYDTSSPSLHESQRTHKRSKFNKEDIRPKAADLVMMNVPEKLAFMQKRKKILKELKE